MTKVKLPKHAKSIDLFCSSSLINFSHVLSHLLTTGFLFNFLFFNCSLIFMDFILSKARAVVND